ncbi:hypothetical protein BST27_04685 [Mycobacterium intermedium]|uniref:Uncharacterized protein n=1 Tax=Mycobacterium intermedium TaxID=28445 RepID=A0A1E3SM89_MYCIE|nr:Rv1535 family protein [Mycobacterium intermedium]MCV6966954.1 hypothetical protein [Mycobacterium intermedium]ODR03274.1 hypothetical protein BHQ20_00010 [Mycobacterium intermedium]OPE47199.1 hypothetical protein BV508_22890 [Mycobacterium intermedium]ORB09656.1 hypothetical protein BST27_04685 [Mycobacterium intermedium]
MTAALCNDEVGAVTTAPQLHLVRDDSPIQAAPKKASRRVNTQPFGGGDPLVEGAARLLCVPLRHVYAALWRIGVLEVQA